MTEADDILQGLLIGAFGFTGVITFVYCCLKRKTREETSHTMKPSPSMENLNGADDPIMV